MTKLTTSADDKDTKKFDVKQVIDEAKQAVDRHIPTRMEDIFPEKEKHSIMLANAQRKLNSEEITTTNAKSAKQKKYYDENISARNFSRALLHDKILLGDLTFFSNGIVGIFI
jgi:hypothetical protein